jgi:hypothetical protein
MPLIIICHERDKEVLSILIFAHKSFHFLYEVFKFVPHRIQWRFVEMLKLLWHRRSACQFFCRGFFLGLLNSESLWLIAFCSSYGYDLPFITVLAPSVSSGSSVRLDLFSDGRRTPDIGPTIFACTL